jgi:photosynthetic reaction center cytochrome c subunit
MSAAGTTLGVAGLAGAVLLLGGCELGRKTSQQTGYRGTGMEQIVNVDRLAKVSAIPAPPYALPDDSGPRARETYQNVKVLGDVSTERFNHLMAAINQWVAPPEQGCNYCHNPNNMASDEKYTKIVARRMLQMTRQINGTWSSHVKTTGVTCYTCHRGNAVPAYKWAIAEGVADPDSIVRNKHGQNTPNVAVGYASLPYDPFATYLDGKAQIRVATNGQYPSRDHVVSIKDAEKTYGLMMHMSSALGVNCTYCHNSQSFRSWTLSRPQRATAYYGIRMVRDINLDYIGPLASVFPAYRKGPHGDAYKVNCQTCHQGQSKPLAGISMLAANPTLKAAPMPTAAPEGGAAGADVPAVMANPRAMTSKQ